MELINKEQIKSMMNDYGSKHKPFFFMIDFKGENGVVIDLNDLPNSEIHCSINGKEIGKNISVPQKPIELNIKPITLQKYKKSFESVMQHIKHGDTYLLNLTFPTNIGSNINLYNIYQSAKAPYKLLFEDKFTFYSPEPFIRIENNRIFSYPMKGTISANLPDAEKQLMENKKELYEHYTIVDLIRNDLAMVSENISVDKFRYIEQINSKGGAILQTSSQISGKLKDSWRQQIGDMLFRLLPAGSISGAPKEKTIEIIDKCEIDNRGFYTGVMGVFDGKSIDSCVIIRYIERSSDGYFYRSGGGITSLSSVEEEYNEIISKIYVPTI